jgi:uncharacterized protein (TIGR02001 family)
MNMKKKGILLAAVILLSAAGLVQAQEGELGVTLDVTYVSRYIWRGFDVYNNNTSAIQPSIDIDFYVTGFGVNIWSSRANASGFENAEELDITLYYYNSLFEGETYATDYRVGWLYYNYPDNPPSALDMQEFFAELSWPNICPAGIVPSYTIIRMWPATSNSSVSSADGWIHIVGLGYDWTVEGLLPETQEQTLHLSADLVYNDGAGGVAVDHDWSHMLFGVSTDFEVADNLTFTPALYYQASMENTVNTQDEFWVGLSLKYKF